MSLLEELKKRQANGFAPAAPAPIAPQVPTAAPAPAVGPTNFNQMFPTLAPQAPQPLTAELPTLQEQGQAGAEEFYADRAAARGPMEDDSFFGNIGAAFSSAPSEVTPRGGTRATGAGGAPSPIAAARTGGVATAENPDVGNAFSAFMNPSAEQIAANLAGGRTGGVQSIPSATPPAVAPLAPETVTSPQVATPTGEVAPAPTPAVEPSAPAPQAGGGVTKDGVFYPTQPEPEAGPSGMTRGGVFTPTQQPTGALKTFEDNLKATIAAGGETPQMAAQRASEASPSASASQVALAESAMQQQEAERAADRAAEKYGKTLPLGGQSIGAREEKIAEFRKEFVDKQKEVKTRTPEQVESDQLKVEAQRKQNEILDARIEKGKSPDATPAEKTAAARAQGVKEGTITQAQADEATKQDLIGKPPLGYATWAEYEADTGVDHDKDGKVSTAAEAEAAAPTEAIERQAFETIEEAEAANLPVGTKITIGGRNATT